MTFEVCSDVGLFFIGELIFVFDLTINIALFALFGGICEKYLLT